MLFAKSGGRINAAAGADNEDDERRCSATLAIPTDRRMWAVFRALERGWPVEDINRLTHIDPLVPHAVSADRRARRRRRRPWARATLSDDLLRELKRAGFGDGHLGGILGIDEDSVRARRTAEAEPRRRLQAHRHLRGRVRVVHAVSLRDVRAGVRSGTDGAAEGRHPRQRPEPHRPGHRVRLLLLSRGVRAARRRLRDGDDQLQSRRRSRPTTTRSIGCTSSR